MKRYFLRSAVSRSSRRRVAFGKKKSSVSFSRSKSGIQRPTSQHQLGKKPSTTRRRRPVKRSIWNCANISPCMCKCFASMMTLLLFTGAIVMVVLYFQKQKKTVVEKPNAMTVIREFMILQNESFRGKNDLEILSGVQHLAQYLSQLKSRSDEIETASNDIIKRLVMGWKPFSGSLYWFSLSLLPFQTAIQTCDQQKGHLVDITSQEEEKYLEDKVDKQRAKFFIGLVKNGTRWQWLTGKPLTNGFWGQGQGVQGDCAIISKCKTEGKCWESAECNVLRKWICKLKANPKYL